MKITEFRLSNCGIIPELKIGVKNVVRVQGKNGVGKSTIITAVRTLFDGGVPVDLVGPGGDEAVIEGVFDDGVIARKVVKKATAKRKKSSAELIVTRSDGSDVPSPAKYMESLASGLTLNPTALVNAKKEDRIEFLQGVMDTKFTREELEQATGEIYPQHEGGVGLTRFDEMLEGQLKLRTRANGIVDELSAYEVSLRRNLPAADDDKDWAAEVKRLTTAREARRAALRETERDIEQQTKDAIAEAEKERDAAIAAAQQAYSTKVANIRKVAAEETGPILNPMRTEIEKLTADLTQAEERAKATQAVSQNRTELVNVQSRLKAALGDAGKLDRIVAGLRKLREAKLAELPIPGLEFKDGELFYKGLNFDTQLNKAKKYMLAFRIAAEQGNKLPFFVMDDAEGFDPDTEAEFIRGCEEGEFQVIMARVVEGQQLTIQ